MYNSAFPERLPVVVYVDHDYEEQYMCAVYNVNIPPSHSVVYDRAVSQYCHNYEAGFGETLRDKFSTFKQLYGDYVLIYIGENFKKAHSSLHYYPAFIYLYLSRTVHKNNTSYVKWDDRIWSTFEK